MKALKIGFTLFAMLVMVTFTNAQSTAKESTEAKTARYIKALGLDNEQADKAKKLNLKYERLFNGAATPEEKKKYVGEYDVEVKSILTDAQYAKYKEMVAKERRQKMSGPRPKPAPGK